MIGFNSESLGGQDWLFASENIQNKSMKIGWSSLMKSIVLIKIIFIELKFKKQTLIIFYLKLQIWETDY